VGAAAAEASDPAAAGATAAVAAAATAEAATAEKRKGAGKGPPLTPKSAGVGPPLWPLAAPPVALTQAKLSPSAGSPPKGKGKGSPQPAKGAGASPTAAAAPSPVRHTFASSAKGKGKGLQPPKSPSAAPAEPDKTCAAALQEPDKTGATAAPPASAAVPSRRRPGSATAPAGRHASCDVPTGDGQLRGAGVSAVPGQESVDRLRGSIMRERTAREALQEQLKKLERRLNEVANRHAAELREQRRDFSQGILLLERRLSESVASTGRRLPPTPAMAPAPKASDASTDQAASFVPPAAAVSISRPSAEDRSVDLCANFSAGVGSFLQRRCDWAAVPPCVPLAHSHNVEAVGVGEASASSTGAVIARQMLEAKLDELQELIVREKQACEARHISVQELLAVEVAHGRESTRADGAQSKVQELEGMIPRFEALDRRLTSVERSVGDLGDRTSREFTETWSRFEQVSGRATACETDHDNLARLCHDLADDRVGLNVATADRLGSLEQRVEEALRRQGTLAGRIHRLETASEGVAGRDVFSF